MTTRLPPSGAANPEDRMAISGMFIQHAREELERDSRLQASEKAWGAMAQALKAIAQTRGWKHRGHDNVLDIGGQIGQEYNLPAAATATEKANALHRNFYENNDNAAVIEETIIIIEDVLPDLEDARLGPPRPYTISHRSDRNRLRRLTGNRDLEIGDTSPVGFSLNHSSGSGNGGGPGPTSPGRD